MVGTIVAGRGAEQNTINCETGGSRKEMVPIPANLWKYSNKVIFLDTPIDRISYTANILSTSNKYCPYISPLENIHKCVILKGVWLYSHYNKYGVFVN